MVAAAAWLLWGAAAARAQVRWEEHQRHPGGSVRYGAVAAPRAVPLVPVVPPASVRYEHYHRDHDWDRSGRPLFAAPAPGVVYRNPYRAEYFRHFRPGYRPIVVGGSQYYAYPVLPLGYQAVAVNGVTYYVAEGVYYQPYLYQGQTVYMAVPPPLP